MRRFEEEFESKQAADQFAEKTKHDLTQLFCPIAQDHCHKDCVAFREPYVKEINDNSGTRHIVHPAECTAYLLCGASKS